MDLRELRIGNLVWETSNGNPSAKDFYLFEVAAINELTNTLIDRQDNITEIDYCYPIPLDEKWITEAGLRMVTTGFYNHPAMKKLFRWVDRASITSSEPLEIPYLYVDGLVRLYYVHQLQNFFFSLTGKELTLVPTPELSPRQ